MGTLKILYDMTRLSFSFGTVFILLASFGIAHIYVLRRGRCKSTNSDTFGQKYCIRPDVGCRIVST